MLRAMAPEFGAYDCEQGDAFPKFAVASTAVNLEQSVLEFQKLVAEYMNEDSF